MKPTTSFSEDLIAQGVAANLVRLEDDRGYITYDHEKLRLNFNNPEEQVRANAYLTLILTYKYPKNRIKLEVPITRGSTTTRADIIVFKDDACQKPFIVVECKRQEVSEQEFRQAVNQAIFYAHAIAGTVKYIWVTSGIKDAYYKVDKESKQQQVITDIPQKDAEPAKYKYVKGGGTSNGQQMFELKKVQEDELTRRFKQAHQALWGGGEMNPSTAFDELDKLIFCKIWDEKKPRKQGQPYDFQKYEELKAEQSLLKRVKDLYEEGRKREPEVFKDDIRLDASKLSTVVGYLESINLSETDLDAKGRAFETFMGSFFRGDFGQYFTPRTIVEFIVDVLPIKNDSLVLDTSCGSGGFLLHALDKVRQQAEEFYDSNDPRQATEHYRFWHDFAEKNLYGIEINEQIARVAKMNMIIHDDGHTNVVATDGLQSQEDIIDKTGNKGFQKNRFDFIITNPPFGSSVKQTEKAYMKHYRLSAKETDWLNPKSKAAERPSQSTEVLFIEQCAQFLKPGGYLAIVIPDGLLTNSSLQYVRDSIEEMYRIVAVVSMPQTAFTSTGAGVKSSVLFLRRHSEEQEMDICNRKQKLKDNLKSDQGYLKHYRRIEQEKKQHLKELRGFDNSAELPLKELQKTDAYKQWKADVTAYYREKLDKLKEEITDLFEERRRETFSPSSWDYTIFMAIAEDIGYDATGKPTGNNELEAIAPELAKFIENIERFKA